MLPDEPLLSSRRAGVCLHITSLPGPYGIGELGVAARSFVDLLCRMKLSVWQVLPVGPTAYGNSPYQPLSTFAGNELLLDVDELLELRLLRPGEADELQALPTQHVDYGALIPLKSRLLALAASRFKTTVDAATLDEFRRFVEKHDRQWLHDYALFRVLKSRHDNRPWTEWQTAFVHRDAAALAQIEVDEAHQIEAVKVIQFLFFRQWATLRDYAHEKGIVLFGDMPIYIALDSADAWSNPGMLQLDASGNPTSVAGVPPDYFSEDGQLWGNPLYQWEIHAADGFQWWIDRLSFAFGLFDLVRIDHFRGFESYWAIPADADTARHGAWRTGPGDALFDAVRNALGNLPIVAEDLGIITHEVTALRERHNLPGMRVLQFDVCDPDFELGSIGENCICYTGTHDNDTTSGWFLNNQDDALRFTKGTAETIHLDLIKVAFATSARIAIAPLQDFLGLGSEARTNIPGTSSGNWQWRVLDAELKPEICDNIASMVNASKRGLPTNEQSK